MRKTRGFVGAKFVRRPRPSTQPSASCGHSTAARDMLEMADRLIQQIGDVGVEQ